MNKDIYYIVSIKDAFGQKLTHTTINKEFCGKFDHEAYGVVWFKLNGSRAHVAIPKQWIEWIAPAEKLWNK